MPFVRRNAEDEVEAVFAAPEEGATEELPAGSEELVAFFGVGVMDIINNFDSDNFEIFKNHLILLSRHRKL